jgi:hypothetical protein
LLNQLYLSFLYFFIAILFRIVFFINLYFLKYSIVQMNCFKIVQIVFIDDMYIFLIFPSFNIYDFNLNSYHQTLFIKHLNFKYLLPDYLTIYFFQNFN